jgi:hypothetical protein
MRHPIAIARIQILIALLGAPKITIAATTYQTYYEFRQSRHYYRSTFIKYIFWYLLYSACERIRIALQSSTCAIMKTGDREL